MHDFLPERDHIELIASFGQATLVRTMDFKYELRGGSEEDRSAAEEWVSRFFPDLDRTPLPPDMRRSELESQHFLRPSPVATGGKTIEPKP